MAYLPSSLPKRGSLSRRPLSAVLGPPSSKAKERVFRLGSVPFEGGDRLQDRNRGQHTLKERHGKVAPLGIQPPCKEQELNPVQLTRFVERSHSQEPYVIANAAPEQEFQGPPDNRVLTENVYRARFPPRRHGIEYKLGVTSAHRPGGTFARSQVAYLCEEL
jgi:hypothetical protein